MMDMEYNRTSPFISNCLHYSSEFHPYVGEFAYLCSRIAVKRGISLKRESGQSPELCPQL